MDDLVVVSRTARRSKSADAAVEQLLAKANRTLEGCLLSHLRPNKKGYIPISLGGRNGKKWRAHRLIYQTIIGPTDGYFVLHKCHNRNCINPDHLYLGTAEDNTTDMMFAGNAANQSKKGYGYNYAHPYSKTRKR